MVLLSKERPAADFDQNSGPENPPRTMEQMLAKLNERRFGNRNKIVERLTQGDVEPDAVEAVEAEPVSRVDSGEVDAMREISARLADISDAERKQMLSSVVEATLSSLAGEVDGEQRQAELRQQFEQQYESMSEEEKQKIFAQHIEDLATPFAELSEHSKRDTIEYLQLVKDVKAFDQLDSLVSGYAAKHRELFEDKRFVFEGADGASEHMMKDSFGKLKCMEWLQGMFADGQIQPADLRKVARLSFDANGLKAVNDLSGSHDKGDAYLRKVAEIFRNKDSRARQMLTDLGVDENNFLPLLGGGDEYSVLVRSDREFSADELNEVVKQFELEIRDIDGIDELVDLQNDLDVRLRFMGLTRAEFDLLDQTGQAEVLERADRTIPKDFKMWASASGGVATLADGLVDAANDNREVKRLTGDEDSHILLAKIMGGLWDASDKRAEHNKKEYKEALKNGTELEQFYSVALKRTEEARQLEKREKRLSDELALIEAAKQKMRDELLSQQGIQPQEFITRLYAQLEQLSLDRQEFSTTPLTAEQTNAEEPSEINQSSENNPAEINLDIKVDAVQLDGMVETLRQRYDEQSGLDLERSDVASDLEQRLAALPEKQRQQSIERLTSLVEHIDAQITERQLEVIDQVEAIVGEPNREQTSAILSFETELNQLFKQRDNFLERELLMFDLAYSDSRFKFEGPDGQEERMMKDAFGKLKTIDWVKDMYRTGQPKIEDFDKIARFSFDANGLKAVNDLSGSHNKGDEYLKKIAEVFRNPHSPGMKILRDLGATEILPLLGGGDEYSVLVKSDQPLQPANLEQALAEFKRDIESLDVSNLVDFSDPKVLERSGLKDMPANFKMRASASASVATLGEGLKQTMSDPRQKKRLTGGESSLDIQIGKLVGGLWDISDKKADDDKKIFKRRLAASKQIEDQIYSRVLKRTDEARNTENTINELVEKIGREDQLINDLLTGVAGIGGSEGSGQPQEIDMSVLALDSLQRLVSQIMEK
ncbi:MAG: hypothetical protein V1738_01615 [Patescibacteria group bacterium]